MQPCCSSSVASEDLRDLFLCPSSDPPKQTQILILHMCIYIYNQNIKSRIKIYDFINLFFLFFDIKKNRKTNKNKKTYMYIYICIYMYIFVYIIYIHKNNQCVFYDEFLALQTQDNQVVIYIYTDLTTQINIYIYNFRMFH